MRQAIINDNFSDYFNHYISLVSDNSDVISTLENTHKNTNNLLDLITEKQGDFTYADGKWSIKELLAHMIDTERIFCNRALRIARNDKTDMPDYNHDTYAPESGANERRLIDIYKEFNVVREGTIALFNSFTPEMLERSGTANGNPFTVLAIGFIISGHEIHHINVMNEKYL